MYAMWSCRSCGKRGYHLPEQVRYISFSPSLGKHEPFPGSSTTNPNLIVDNRMGLLLRRPHVRRAGAHCLPTRKAALTDSRPLQREVQHMAYRHGDAQRHHAHVDGAAAVGRTHGDHKPAEPRAPAYRGSAAPRGRGHVSRMAARAPIH